jgi:hypothetical protein
MNLEKALKKGSELLSFVEKCMAESNSEWALGTKEYSFADIFLQVYFHRAMINPTFVEKEVRGRPNISKYFDKIVARPSSQEANLKLMTLPSNFTMYAGALFVLSGLNALFYLGLNQFDVKVDATNTWKFFGAFTIGICAVCKYVCYSADRKLWNFCNDMAAELERT